MLAATRGAGTGRSVRLSVVLSPGALLGLTIEKPAAGGRMIARADGCVVLVSNAIPGERVIAQVERVGKDVAYARTLSVEDASPDRRESLTDPLCGGCLYAHIEYKRQLMIKAQVIADAFLRIGGVTLPGPVPVAASPDEGYRMRARLHVRGGRVGFFRESTHDLCDARATRQLLPATCDVLDRMSAGLRSLGAGGPSEIELSENVEGSQRVLCVDTTPLDERIAAALEETSGLTGLAASHRHPAVESSGRRRSRVGRPSAATVVTLAGEPYVIDVIPIDGCEVSLRRHVLTFFQGNRYLLRDLVAHVVQPIRSGSQVIDLYAGAGLFSVSAAIARGARVTAVEGEQIAALDLAANARLARGGVAPIHEAVEAFMRSTPPPPDTLIVDPPRTGMSREAVAGAVALRARQIVYVSCDIATLARDVRHLLGSGYGLEGVQAFDLFPNTPHVETVAVFERGLQAG